MALEDQFVYEIKCAIIDDSVNRYIKFIQERSETDVEDDDWSRFAVALHEKGAIECSATVFRHIIVDVVANILGILDGSSNLETLRGDIRVVYDGRSLDPTLSEIFWESEQEDHQNQD